MKTFIILLSIVFCIEMNAEETSKPNVLFIMSDDLNTALSGFGHPLCKTPNLDKLAMEGTAFRNAFCQYPICGPSRASIFSGQYPIKNGVLGNGGLLSEKTLTLPQHFKNNGYWTGRVSKLYHMAVPGDIMAGSDGGDHPPSWTEKYNITAYESFSPGKNITNFTSPEAIKKYPEFRKMIGNGFTRNDAKKTPGGHHWVQVETVDDDNLLADNMAAVKAIDLLRQRKQDKKPFFLAVGFVRPHFPYVAPESDFALYQADKMVLPENPDAHFEKIPGQARGKDIKVNDQDRQRIRRAYYACVTYMDRQVGRVLDELDKLGLRDNTIIVFASDHGYLLGEHRIWKKHKLWEEAIRAPMIISAPGQKSKGVNFDRNVELLDIYPTVLELASLPSVDGIQGISLKNLLDYPDADSKRIDVYTHTTTGHCLRSGKWAYMWYQKGKKGPEASMLYDMEKDPNQYNNLSKNPEYASIQKKLHLRLMERIEQAKN